MSESLALQAAIDFDQGGRAYPIPMLSLPGHLRKLARTLVAIGQNARLSEQPNLIGVSSLLGVAGALADVTANTAIDDSSIYMCGSAMAFADAESAVASRYLAGTIMFNFAWMALEQTILAVAPPSKGTTGAKGRNAFAQALDIKIDIDEALKLTWSFARSAGDMEDDLRVLEAILPTAPPAETAFELVRRVRNAFAHGRLTPPQPSDWNDGNLPPASPEVDRFFACTRLSLLLTALLLANTVNGGMMDCHPEDALYLENEDDYLHEAPVVWSLQTAHVAEPDLPPEVTAGRAWELA